MWNTQQPPSAGKSLAVPEQSAYDIPAGSVAPSLLGASIVENLYLKGFCTIELGIEYGLHEAAVRNVDSIWSSGRFQTPPPLVVDGLLGESGSSLIAHLGGADDSADGEAIAHLDGMISDMGAVMAPLLPQLDFEIEDRTAGLLHQTGSEAPGSDDDLTDLEAQKWLTQFWWHRIMVCIFLGPDEGMLELVPYADEEANGYAIPTKPGMMVILRPDVLGHFHTSKGRSIALTAFFMQPVSHTKPSTIPTSHAILDWVTQRLRAKKAEETWDTSVPRELQHMGNHLFHRGPRIAVKSSPGRFPTSWDPGAFQSSMMFGLDAAELLPTVRWDHEVGKGSFDPNPESWKWHMSNIRHGAFCEGLELFDNKIFNLSVNESRGMDPQQRLLLEVAYEGLWNGGMRKKDFFNSNGACYIGVTSAEWGWAEKSQEVAQNMGSGSVVCIYSNRINYVLGLKGPSVSVDQEGASAITCVHLARLAIEDHYPNGEKKGGHISTTGIGLGSYLLLSNRSLSLQTAAGYLSTIGRCLSFDATGAGIARGEGVAGCIIKPYTKMMDGEQVVLDSNNPPVGVLCSTSTNCSAVDASIRAPHGPALQEIMCSALDEAQVSPLDVDNVEVHGEGRLLPDVIDVSTALFALRQDQGRDLQQMPELAIGSVKSGYGHAKEAAGAVALIKALYNSQLGVAAPNVHLRIMNPHIDNRGLEDLAIINSEPLANVGAGCSFTAVISHGHGGSNSQALVWNTTSGFQKVERSETPLQREVVFWPGGGGELEDEATDCQAYHIVGSWTKWEDPEEMEPEGEGTFGFTITLGENNFEQFQILLDGDSQRVLHPGQTWGPKSSLVYGPSDAPAAGASAWAIDGRRQLASGGRGGGAPALMGEEASIEGAASGSLVDTTDTAEPGEAFRVRLRIAGKWRVVTWEKIGPINPDLAPERSDGGYYITGDFNGWTFDRMAPSYSDFGLHTADVRLFEAVGNFQIVRDCSWDQVFHPPFDQAYSPEKVVGPSSGGDGKTWCFNGNVGDVFRVQFLRTREEGRDVKKLSWQLASSESVTTRELIARGQGRLFLLGSWDDWETPKAMTWDGSAYACRVRIGQGRSESFQITVGGSGAKKVYPDRNHAGPYTSHTLVGPSETDSSLCWTIGYHSADRAEPGSAFNVRLLMRDGKFAEVKWERLR